MFMTSTKTAGPTIRGACILTALGIIAPAAGIATESKSAPAPKPAPAPAHPTGATAPAAGKPGTGPATGVPQSNNGHPAPNSITTSHYPGQPSRPITTGTQPHPPGPQIHPPVAGPGPHPGPGTRPVVGRTDPHVPPGHIPPRAPERHDYQFHGRPLVVEHRVDAHGRPSQVFYSRYTYHGVPLRAYRPAHYYSPGFYRWAGRPWATPVHYGWAWRSDPWYGYYGPYFAPAPVYTVPALWVTDYVIAANLQAAYEAQNAAQPPGPPSNPTPLSPEVKQQIADEVQHQMQQETAEANANAQGQIPNSPMGVEALFADKQTHVFVASSDLSLTDSVSGRPCQVTQGDVLQVQPLAPGNNSSFVTATVLASKGGSDCGATANVSVKLDDLQEMQNHMRETADEGLKELQAKQGQGGLPSAPSDATTPPVSGAFVDAAPAPDPQAADLAQNQTGQQAGLRGMNLTASPAPVTISPGQSIATVVNSIGPPTTILNLGAKQVYLYKNPGMRVTFVGGKVTNIE